MLSVQETTPSKIRGKDGRILDKKGMKNERIGVYKDGVFG